jgi:hypothetical protein
MSTGDYYNVHNDTNQNKKHDRGQRYFLFSTALAVPITGLSKSALFRLTSIVLSKLPASSCGEAHGIWTHSVYQASGSKRVVEPFVATTRERAQFFEDPPPPNVLIRWARDHPRAKDSFAKVNRIHIQWSMRRSYCAIPLSHLRVPSGLRMSPHPANPEPLEERCIPSDS